VKRKSYEAPRFVVFSTPPPTTSSLFGLNILLSALFCVVPKVANKMKRIHMTEEQRTVTNSKYSESMRRWLPLFSSDTYVRMLR